MTMEINNITPQQILAGNNVTSGPNPVSSELQSLTGQPPAAGGADGQPSIPISDVMTAVGPNPPKGGISESPRMQFLRAAMTSANSLSQSSSNPSAPGAWARALVGGVQSALAGVGAIGKVPEGAGALYGVGKVAGAMQQRQDEQKQEAQKQKQQNFENQLQLTREEREQEAADSQRMATQIQVQRSLHEMDKDDQDQMYTSAQKQMKGMIESGARVVQEGMTSADLMRLAQQENPKDPQGWLMKQNVVQSGFQDAIGPDGKPAYQKDVNGNVVGGAPRRATYSILTWGEPRQVDGQFAGDIKKYLNKNITEGTQLDPRDARDLENKVDLAKAQYIAGRKLDVAAGMTNEQIDQLEKNAAYKDALPVFLHWLNDANGDPGQAMKNAEDHAKESGQGSEADRQYQMLVKGFGQEVIQDQIKQFDTKQTAAVKAAAEAAKNNPLPLEGDTAKNGEQYIQSLPQGRQKLVRDIVNGQLGELNPRILSTPQGQLLFSEAAQADPSIDMSRIGNYKNLLKEFTTGKSANQIKAINTGLPHLADLYQAVDKNWTGALPVVGWAERKLGVQSAADINTFRTQAEQELAGMYAQGAITDQEHRTFEGELDTASPWELKNTLYDVVNLLQNKINSLNDQWDKGVPSPNWRPNREMVDDESKRAISNIQNWHTGTSTPTAKPVAASKQPPIPAGFTRLTDGAGNPYDVPSGNVDAALKKYPNLKVVGVGGNR